MTFPHPASQPAEALLNTYMPAIGALDELMTPDGVIRNSWRRFMDHLGPLSPDEMAKRFSRGDQYLRDAGVYYRHYEAQGSTERDWPLSHIPVVLEERDWRALADGLIQRATLLEGIAKDFYGENRLVRDGHLPAAIVAGNPHWLRPLVGAVGEDRHFLHFIAFDVGRGPDGAWWVLGDRVEAPSGAGFALENRVATSRVFPEVFASANVLRLAGFFQDFRHRLLSLRAETDSQIAILSPGLMNDTYFEHAYIARYLGFSLLEGADLAVDANRLMVRTVADLSPISVVWRRLDARFADPLELDEDSALGTPGLVQAIRESRVEMVNALGVGVLESRAMMAFMPRLCQALLREDLAISNIATWWCGDETAQAYVRANSARMIIGPAFSTQPAFEGRDGAPFDGSAVLNAHHVGQEHVSLSTTPAYVDGKLVPRPMVLRVFLARTKDGWTVMPGGYARIGRSQDAKAIAMQQGGSAADVWVVSDRPVKPITLMASNDTLYRRAEAGVLPARAGDNLFWMGRYVERAQSAARRLRAYHLRLAEAGGADNAAVRLLGANLSAFGIDKDDAVPTYLLRTLDAALGSASQVRDRFSLDGWMALNDLRRTLARMRDTSTPGDDAARAMSVMLRKIAGFSGLVHENMHRSGGWYFLTIGQSLERALSTCEALSLFADPAAPEGALDLAVEIGDSAMIHRRRYAITTQRAAVIDLLVFDTRNPRAVLFQLARIRTHLDALEASRGKTGQNSDPMRALVHCESSLLIETPESLHTTALHKAQTELAALSDLIALAYFK